MILNLDFDADPDPAFDFDVDPDLALRSDEEPDADPASQIQCRSRSRFATLNTDTTDLTHRVSVERQKDKIVNEFSSCGCNQ